MLFAKKISSILFCVGYFGQSVFCVDSLCIPELCNQHGHCEGIGDSSYCLCDIGYTSSTSKECDIKICPKGDDPTTENQNYREINLTTGTKNGTVGGYFEFGFNGEKVSIIANTNYITETELAASIMQLPSIEKVSITRTKKTENGGATYFIKFLKWPQIPYENNFYSHIGNPTLKSFMCDAKKMTSSGDSSPFCILSDVSNLNIREYVPCSGRGKCDESIGSCICDSGWNGVACDIGVPHIPTLILLSKRQGKSNILQGTTKIIGGDGLDIKTESIYHAISASFLNAGVFLYSHGKNLTSSMLNLSFDHEPVNSFNIMSATSTLTKDTLFEIDGTGFVRTAAGIMIGNNLSSSHMGYDVPQFLTPKAVIGSGGIKIDKGSLDVIDGNFKISGNGSLTIENGSSSFHSFGAASTIVVTRHLESEIPLNATLLIDHSNYANQSPTPYIAAVTNGRKVFQIGSNGGIISHGGIVAKSGGINVESGGIKIRSGGIEVDGGIQIKSGTLQFTDHSDGFELLEGGVRSSTTSLSIPAFTGTANNNFFQGSIMKLVGPPDPSGDKIYNFMEFSQSFPDHSLNMLTFKSNGDIYTKGGLAVASDIISQGKLSMNGGISIHRISVTASDTILIEDISKVSFLEVFDDGVQAENEIVFKGDPKIGQLLFFMNNDLHDVIGSELGKIPPSTLHVFLYSEPNGWVEVTALAAHQRSLTGVTKLEAENDLDIGSYAFSSAAMYLTSKNDFDSQGQILFFGPSGKLMGDKNMKFDESTHTLWLPKFRAKEFAGDTLDFNGGALINAALINATIDRLQHLTVKSIGILDVASGEGRGDIMAIINDKGLLKSTKLVRWDAKKEVLKLPSISSISNSGIKVCSDLDMMSHTIYNANIAKGTTLSGLSFQDGIIKNSVLKNVTANDLKLGSVEMRDLSLTKFAAYSDLGKLVEIGEGGGLFASEYFQNANGILEIKKDVQFGGRKVNLKGANLLNTHMISGSIKGDGIDIEAQSLAAKSITISTIKDNKQLIGDSLLIIDEEGKIKRGVIPSNEDGSLGNFRIAGRIDFVADNTAIKNLDKSKERGTIAGAFIDGGDIADIQRLEVIGETSLTDTFIDGSLTVTGSVLGSGPYVDVSDSRLKKNVKPLSSSNSLKKLLKIRGVSYELDSGTYNWRALKKSRKQKEKGAFIESKFGAKNKQPEIGFIAQEVEKEFPHLVEHMVDGYKGLQYSRFVPIIVEALKELHYELDFLKKDVEALLVQNTNLRNDINQLRAKSLSGIIK